MMWSNIQMAFGGQNAHCPCTPAEPSSYKGLRGTRKEVSQSKQIMPDQQQSTQTQPHPSKIM